MDVHDTSPTFKPFGRSSEGLWSDMGTTERT